MHDRKHHLRKTRNKTSDRIDYILLGIIILVAAILRLWKFEPIPFALMGIASIYLVFKVGKQWFNNKVGLLAAAFFAVSQFTVICTPLERPYFTGMFSILLFAVFWNEALFSIKRQNIGIWIALVCSASMAAWTHPFCAIQVGLMLLTGLFYLPKSRHKTYWASGICVLVLYTISILISKHIHIESSNIPASSFLIDFVQYTMNDASLFIFATGIIMLLPIILQRRQKRSYPIRWAALAWFLITFAVAYVYSMLREPIIQYNTLIFSYPFLIISAFSLFKNNTMTKLQTVAVVAVLLFAGATTLMLS